VSNQVYANMMEVSCKAAAGKSICAFPDVCMTPPQTPATPPGVPIPYPNTGMASDCTDGSSTVQISGQEIMLKNKSYFKRSSGDEAGCAPLKGVVTHQNMGKVYFNMWSMDVLAEGENVVRNLDMTTHNHASVPGNGGPWPYVDEAAMPGITKACQKDIDKEKKNCEGDPHPCRGLEELPPHGKGVDRINAKPAADRMADAATKNDCLNARRCRLSAYEGEYRTCCPGQTPHHLVEASSFGAGRGVGGSRFTTFSNSPVPYSPGQAPCVCAEGTSSAMGGTHELMHVFQKAEAMKVPMSSAGLPTAGGGNSGPTRTTTYGQAKESGTNAFMKVFDDAGCEPDCIKAQLDAYHRQCGIDNNTQCNAITAGPSEQTMSVQEAEAEALERSWERWVSTGPQGSD